MNVRWPNLAKHLYCLRERPILIEFVLYVFQGRLKALTVPVCLIGFLRKVAQYKADLVSSVPVVKPSRVSEELTTAIFESMVRRHNIRVRS